MTDMVGPEWDALASEYMREVERQQAELESFVSTMEHYEWVFSDRPIVDTERPMEEMK